MSLQRCPACGETFETIVRFEGSLCIHCGTERAVEPEPAFDDQPPTRHSPNAIPPRRTA